MPIALRTSGNAVRSSSGTSLVPAWASGVPALNDQLLLVIAEIVQDTIGLPAGWSLLGSQDAGTGLRAYAYQKKASASEAASYSITLDTATKGWAWIGAYSGVSAVAAVGFGQSTPGSGKTLSAPTLAVPEQGWIVNARASRRAATGSASSHTYSDAVPPAAERFDWSSDANSGNDVAGAVYDSNRPLPASSPSRSITSTITDEHTVMFSFALTPDVLPPLGSGSFVGWGIAA